MQFFEDAVIKIIDWCTESGIKILIGLIILAIGWQLIRKVVSVFEGFSEKKSIDSTLHLFFSALINIALKALLIVCVLEYIGFNLSGLTAAIASIGVTIGLALQGSLSNFTGGIIILITRPFNVDDFIETPHYSGTVERIELMYTHLVTPDNKAIMIPNGSISNSPIVNYSRKDTRRVDLTFGVSYDDNILHVKKVLMDIINENNMILKEPEPFINICEHGDSAVNLTVRVWTETQNYWNVHFYLLEQAKLRFDEEKINIPYPQMDVHIKKEV